MTSALLRHVTLTHTWLCGHAWPHSQACACDTATDVYHDLQAQENGRLGRSHPSHTTDTDTQLRHPTHTTGTYTQHRQTALRNWRAHASLRARFSFFRFRRQAIIETPFGRKKKNTLASPTHPSRDQGRSDDSAETTRSLLLVY